MRPGRIMVLLAALGVLLASVPLAGQEKKDPDKTGQTPAAVSETDLLIPEAGQPAGAADPRVTTAPTVSTWDFVRMFLILAGVVGFIYLIFYLFRKGSGRKIQENRLIKVLGSRSLSGNKALHLVEVGTNVFLVGASDSGVRLISRITDKESLDGVRLQAAEQGASGKRTFQDVLSDIFKPARKPYSLDESVDMLKHQRDRLRKM